jgi:hypothetical protein
MVGWIPEFVQYFTVLNHYSKQQKMEVYQWI